MEMQSRLLLLPNTLGGICDRLLPTPYLEKVIPKLDGLIVESEKQGHLYLKRFLGSFEAIRKMGFAVLNRHTTFCEMKDLLKPMLRGEVWGLIADCGLPVLADPGFLLVREAHIKGIQVEAVAGPSSLYLALMLSGFSAQRFSFLGYLSRSPQLLKREILDLEKRARYYQETQLFIETPYRTDRLLDFLITLLHPQTLLCVAANISLPTQSIVSKKVGEWKGYKRSLYRKTPAVFLVAHSDETGV